MKHTRPPVKKAPKEGDLRVWYVINPPNSPVCFPVNTPLHGKQLIEALADSQLLDASIISNAFGMDVFEDGEWFDWQDGDGNGIDDMTISYAIGKPELTL